MGKGLGIFIINIEEVENGKAKGWFINPYLEETVPFRGQGDMMVKMDRTLQELSEKERQEGISHMHVFHSLRDYAFGKTPKFFFLIEILYTYHNSWQGLLTGTNRTRIPFRSALECIQLMEQAMQRNPLKKRRTIRKG